MTRFLWLALALIAFDAGAQSALRQSDALELYVGPFVDSTDGVTAETALTISQADVRLTKCTAAGTCAAAAQKNDVNACTHVENGWYECAFNTTDTDTVGLLTIAVNESGALPVWKEYQIVEEAVYDRDLAAAATGVVGTAQTGDSFARLGAPAGASVSADIVVLDNFVDDLESRLGTPANLGGGATVAQNLSDIEGQTDDIGVAGAGLTNIDLPNQTMDITGTLSTVTTVGTVNALGNDAIQAADIASDVGPEIMASTPTGNGPFPHFGIIDLGTAQAADASSITLRAGFSTAAANMVGVGASVYSSTNGLHSRCVSTAYDNTTKVLTCGGLGAAPTGTVLYALYAIPPGSATSVNVATIEGSDATDQIRDAVVDDATRIDASALNTASVTSIPAILVDTGTTLDDLVDDLESRLGTPANLGGGATVAQNLSDIEGQTDDIGVAGAGLTAADDAVLAALEMHALLDSAFLNCTTNTANFAGSTTTVACILTDRDAMAVTQATGDLEGLQLVILSGDQIREQRFINDTTWDGANSELRLTLSRALPATLADAVTAIIR